MKKKLIQISKRNPILVRDKLDFSSKYKLQLEAHSFLAENTANALLTVQLPNASRWKISIVIPIIFNCFFVREEMEYS